jgi:tetratricopeptide (TPR) repeat protein
VRQKKEIKDNTIKGAAMNRADCVSPIWVNKTWAKEEPQKDLCYEYALRHLSIAALEEGEFFEHTMDALAKLERMTLLRRCRPTRHQEARFWYVAGMLYGKKGQYRIANQAYELCRRRLTARDIIDRITLHLTWMQMALDSREYSSAEYNERTLAKILTIHRACAQDEWYQKAKEQYRALVDRLLGRRSHHGFSHYQNTLII